MSLAKPLFPEPRDMCTLGSLFSVWGCSWHWSGDFLASGGMDHCCKIWNGQRYVNKQNMNMEAGVCVCVCVHDMHRLAIICFVHIWY